MGKGIFGIVDVYLKYRKEEMKRMNNESKKLDKQLKKIEQQKTKNNRLNKK